MKDTLIKFSIIAGYFTIAFYFMSSIIFIDFRKLKNQWQNLVKYIKVKKK